MRPCFLVALCALLAICPSGPVRGQNTLPLQHLWEVQPNFGDIWVAPGPLNSAAIDFNDLLSESPRVRLDTARLICMNAELPGFGDKGKAMERILAALKRSDESILTKRTMISAACLLDNGTHAQQIWDLAREDTVADQEVQQAMIRWKNSIALDHWRNAIRDPSLPASQVRLAIEGIGACGTSEDLKILVELLESESTSIDLRLLVAPTLGKLQTSGLTSLARKYLESSLPDRDLVAVSLLNQHTDDESLALVRIVHEQGGSPAKRIAATFLAERSQTIAEELATAWLNDPDSHFRKLALQVASTGDSMKAIQVAQAMLRDEEDALRTAARHNLLELASGHRENIDAVIKQELDGNDWRSIEQSILLLAELRDSSLCEQLIDLLDHPKAEVHMHAAWALRDLSGEGPILESIFNKALSLTDRLEKGENTLGKSESIMLSLLLETFGRHTYEPAYEMLARYIPKNDYKMGNLSRASAIWSIGKIKKTVDDPDLRSALRERIKDLPPDKPENYLVRFNCILALGEFGFEDSWEVIEQYSGSPPGPLGHAGIWAKEQIKKSGK
jgi:hypothetical protein